MRVGLLQHEGDYFYWADVAVSDLVGAMRGSRVAFGRREDWAMVVHLCHKSGKEWAEVLKRMMFPCLNGGVIMAIRWPGGFVYDFRLKEMGYWPWRKTQSRPVDDRSKAEYLLKAMQD